MYERLRDLIVAGKLAPGTRIIEIDVAKRLGVSRTPVRSALQRLQQEGYVTTPGDGKQARMSVAPLTESDTAELYSIIGVLEGLAASWAAAMDSEPRARLDRDLQRTSSALRRLADEEEIDLTAVFELRTEFHQRIVVAGGRARLIALHASVKPQADRYRHLYLSTASAEQVRGFVRDQEIIRQSIASGDGGAADQAMRRIWRESAEELRRLIRRWGERGSW